MIYFLFFLYLNLKRSQLVAVTYASISMPAYVDRRVATLRSLCTSAIRSLNLGCNIVRNFVRWIQY